MRARTRSLQGLPDQLRAFLGAAASDGWTVAARLGPAAEPSELQLAISLEPLDGLVAVSRLIESAKTARWVPIRLEVDRVGTRSTAVRVVLRPTHSLRMARLTAAAAATRRVSREPLGRPPLMPADVLERIVRARQAHQTYRQIAGRLEEDRIPAPRGGDTWFASTVRAAYERARRESPT